MKIGLVIGALLILLCTAVAGVALSGSSRKAISFAEAKSNGEPCEIYGAIVPSETRYDLRASRLSFVIQEVDEKGNTVPGGERMPVLYTRIKPQSFDDAKHVKAMGVYDGTQFQAESLLVKCPSKYQGQDLDPATARKAYSTGK
jgi:cytochrome c-type biogenesis protein CcmE